ncbi:MAG TPA: crosslink repair DNA glycosylase YcaQ family protein [Euzebyales bacterium]|nr:crosslink repair DNA glycosylase YcaQ family protein [Euzebyales bacterium]
MHALRPEQVRRIALAAQGFDRPRPSGRIDIRHLRGVMRRLDLLQIDAVQTVERSQYLPIFSRLGPYPHSLLDDAAYRRRELFEAWAHEASLVAIERWPALAHRRDNWSSGRAARLEAERPGYIAQVRAEVAARGPLTVGDLSDPGERTGPWWGWSPGKAALEALFAWGEVAIAGRRGQTRSYDLTERVIPAAVRARLILDRAAAYRELLLVAADALGVATADDLADYYRLGVTATRPALDDLVRRGVLEPVEVTGWDRVAYRAPSARLTRDVQAAALLTPFDPLVWYRDRAERVFDFHYRLEFYVPAEQRRYGYFVMPFVLGDTVVARADVKADRRAGVVRVPAAFAEPAVDPAHVAGPLLDELRTLTAWLGLDGVVVDGEGALDHALRRAAGTEAIAVSGS